MNIMTNDTKSSSLKTSEHIVAFIDILGATEMIKEDEDKYLNIISSVIELSLNHFDSFCEEFRSKEKEKIIDNFSIKTFSDNIIISCSLPTDLYQSFFYTTFGIMLHFCSMVQTFFLFEGILIRGAITKGKFFQKTFNNSLNSSLIWGTALLKAYGLEQANAIFPRIIIDPKLIKDLEYNFALTANVSISMKDFILLCIVEDFDNLHFVDYLRSEYNTSLQKMMKAYIDKARDDIKTKISELSIENTSNIKIMQKLNWHSKYLEYVFEKQRVVENENSTNEK